MINKTICVLCCNNVLIDINWITMTASKASNILGIKLSSIYYKIHHGIKLKGNIQ